MYNIKISEEYVHVKVQNDFLLVLILRKSKFKLYFHHDNSTVTNKIGVKYKLFWR